MRGRGVQERRTRGRGQRGAAGHRRGVGNWSKTLEPGRAESANQPGTQGPLTMTHWRGLHGHSSIDIQRESSPFPRWKLGVSTEGVDSRYSPELHKRTECHLLQTRTLKRCCSVGHCEGFLEKSAPGSGRWGTDNRRLSGRLSLSH